MSRLAIDGGKPVRENLLPYGRPSVSEEDIAAVVEVLRTPWLTTGPAVERFESAFAGVAGSGEAVAVSSGTAALHAAMFALGVGPGDEVIVPAMTFAASANCVVQRGATPVFADVTAGTLLIDPEEVRARLTDRTRAIIAVDYAGQPCEYDALKDIASERGLSIVDDAAHSLGGAYLGKPVGSLADLSTFSLHPVKQITSGEGGVITTDDAKLARRMRSFRNHGFTVDHHERNQKGSWLHDMPEPGINCRLTDMQCALAASQLGSLPARLQRRREIAARYDVAIGDLAAASGLAVRDEVEHARHIYVALLELERLSVGRKRVFEALRAEGIGVGVHYIPVHLHTFYRERFGTSAGHCPVAENAYERMLTLPLFPEMTDADADDVLTALERVLRAYAR